MGFSTKPLIPYPPILLCCLPRAGAPPCPPSPPLPPRSLPLLARSRRHPHRALRRASAPTLLPLPQARRWHGADKEEGGGAPRSGGGTECRSSHGGVDRATTTLRRSGHRPPPPRFEQRPGGSAGVLVRRPLPGNLLRRPVLRQRRDPGRVRYRRDRGNHVLYKPHLLPRPLPLRQPLRSPWRRGLRAGVMARDHGRLLRGCRGLLDVVAASPPWSRCFVGWGVDFFLFFGWVVGAVQTKKQRREAAARRQREQQRRDRQQQHHHRRLQLRDERCVSCTTFNILAPVYKRMDSENCRESQYKAYWFSRNEKIIDCLLANCSSIIYLQEVWLGNDELVDMYEKRLGDANYSLFKV